MVLARSYRISRVLHYSGYYCPSPRFAYETFTLFGMLSQNISATLQSNVCSPNPRCISTPGLGSSAFARHYLQNRLFSFSSSGYLDVSVPRVSLPYTMYSCMDSNFLQLPGSPIRIYMDLYGYLLLSMSFRSLSRPSSPLDA